ncbi:MAG: FecR family protein [Flavobacteriaceae bacterium]
MKTPEAKKLFTKYTNNQCSEKEIELLDTFLDSYQKENLNTTTINESKAKVWENIISKIEEEPTTNNNFSFKKYKVLTIAASITLLLVLSIVVKNFSAENSSITKKEETINIGTDKATLTLENGTTVALEKGKKYNNNNTYSSGDSLVYKHNKEIALNETTYNYLTIPNGGQFFVTLSDGTKVWLNSASKLKYPVKFKAKEPRVVELVYGEAYFDVTSSKKNKGLTFTVISKRQKIEVLGTEFNVKDYQDETTTYTTLVEGIIALNTNGNTKILKPKLQAIVNNGSSEITLKPVDVYSQISWKDGVFSFKGKTLKEITKVLSRWYDVKFVFEDKNLETTKFKGVLSKKQPIEEIINSIKSASNIESFLIKNKTIHIK